MKRAISEKSMVVFNYIKEHDGENITAADIADALDMATKSVDGTITAGLQRKGYTERVQAVIETEDENGNTIAKPVKFIKLTADGRAYDHQAALAADAADAANA